MKCKIEKNNENTLVRLRKMGYAPYKNRQGGKSYVRRIHGAEFPRFHLYINNENDKLLEISLHLDQSAPIHKGSSHAHNADNDSKEVKNEIERLTSIKL
jgi:hypothetical protein